MILSNIQRMAHAVKMAGAKPVILTVLPTRLVNPTNGQVKGLDDALIRYGKKAGVRVVNLYQVFIDRLDLLSSDGVHPSDQGYALLARTVAR